MELVAAMGMPALVVLCAALGLCGYTYVGYPALLQLVRLLRRRRSRASAAPQHPASWPTISIALPVYNEVEGIAGTLEQILAIEYPPERRQILVVSDASTDGTDDIVARFAARGVELLRMPRRRGKTAAENAARSRLTGDIIVNTDASVRIAAGAVKHLVAAFSDPAVGVASGRDVSVANVDDGTNPGELAYVGYEMAVRDLETRVDGIVGASGCLYAIRRELHARYLPEHLSRDFGAALVAREQGYRAVSVPAAICYVPRTVSPRREYHRKVRTMARGLKTLWHKRALLNPRRYGLFAWMLWSHKLCRWLTPWAILLMTLALVALAPRRCWAAATLMVGGAMVVTTVIGWLWPEGRRLPRLIALPTYVVTGNIAGLQAWIKALGGEGTALWEPTRRGITSRPADRASRPA
jgi:glycosyltransferase involved in cell wall biosynthesis